MADYAMSRIAWLIIQPATDFAIHASGHRCGKPRLVYVLASFPSPLNGQLHRFARSARQPFLNRDYSRRALKEIISREVPSDSVITPPFSFPSGPKN